LAVEVKVPVLAESVAQASILKWHKKPGDTVKRGDSLTDIETDKVTLEVAAPNSGTLLEILKDEGADVSSNEVIARIETAMGQSPAALACHRCRGHPGIPRKTGGTFRNRAILSQVITGSQAFDYLPPVR